MTIIELSLVAAHHSDPDKAVDAVFEKLSKLDGYTAAPKVKVAQRKDGGGWAYIASLSATKERQ